jgi:hypothetical protein
MKAKIKNIEIAQKKGLGEIKKLLKKALKEPITEASWFFYDTAFDYSGKEGVQPILYIGEKNAFWKQYAKDNKQSKTFASGVCVCDANGRLKLVAETGKGAKALVLKDINKKVLKPFATACLVENLAAPFVDEKEDNNPVANANETKDEKLAAPPFDLEALQKEAEMIMQQGLAAKEALAAVVDSLTKPLGDIKNTIVTDDLIKEASQALDLIQQHPLGAIAKSLKNWLDNAKKEYKAEKSSTSVLNDAEKLFGELDALSKEIPPIEKSASKIQKVKNPMESEVTPISDDPMENIANYFVKMTQSSPLGKHHLESQKFK